MPILNYTTKIDPHRTVGEIQASLAQIGATAVSVDYSAGNPAAIMFLLPVRGRFISFRMPANWRGVYSRLCNDPAVPKALQTEQQARRVTWRILQDWILAQLALVEASIAEPAEIFLPYAVTTSGQTLFQVFDSGQLKLLEGGDS